MKRQEKERVEEEMDGQKGGGRSLLVGQMSLKMSCC